MSLKKSIDDKRERNKVWVMNSGKCLNELQVGEYGEVVTFVDGKGSHIRLMEMGILPGTRLKLVRRAPLGDPLEVEIRGYMLSLRRSDAEKIEVELVEG